MIKKQTGKIEVVLKRREAKTGKPFQNHKMLLGKEGGFSFQFNRSSLPFFVNSPAFGIQTRN